jgi:sterol desaturase/sphingolipid hydroxylase (fatty acid hydroxylase superfamily)
VLHVILEHWQALAAMAGFLFFWCWESLAPFFAQRSRVRHAARNLALAGINALVIVLFFAGATVAVSELSLANSIGLLHHSGLGQPLHLVFGFLILDAFTYWWHRANHRLPLLWRFHRMHHSDPNMDVSTATRFHLGEIAISSTLRLPLIALVGISIPAILLYDFVLLLATQFHHANLGLPSKLDQLLRYAIVSPNMHKVHHSSQRVETDSNYASILSVWDRVFGTYRERRDYHGIHYGLPGFEEERMQSVAGLLSTPFVRLEAESSFSGSRLPESDQKS